jgi:hypothetical protein
MIEYGFLYFLLCAEIAVIGFLIFGLYHKVKGIWMSLTKQDS